MGIKYLNKYLRNKCSYHSIKTAYLKEFSNKTIVIDANIYLYKFKGENALIENVYNMCSILLKYKIKPIFIFDGKPPEEKRELLYQRKIKKREAENNYNLLKNKMDNNHFNKNELIEMENKMIELKKQFIRLDEYSFKITKELLYKLGVEYMESEREADELCAELVISNKAWACMSDDMDLFVYGCPRIIRLLNMNKHSCILYNMENILKDLNMSIEIFREIIVVSGTDYYSNEKNNLYNTIKWYYEYKKYIKKDTTIQPDNHGLVEVNEINMNPLNFRNWLFKYTKYVDDINIINKIYNMFCVNIVCNISISKPNHQH